MKKVIYIILVSLLPMLVKAQVGIGTTDPDNSAALEIKSASKGLLIPAPILAPNNPKKGLLYFDSDASQYMFYDGEKWQILNPTPIGGIIMWSGSTIPDGWALCDGTISNGIQTPDLTGRFIMGSDPANTSTYNKHYKNVSETTVQLTEENIPEHTHTVQANSGAHTHSIKVSISSDTHHHDYSTLENREAAKGGANGRESQDTWADRSDFTTENYTHSHTATVGSFNDGAHSHGATTAWGGNSSGNTVAFSILPPYYTLAFIMRVK